jgi:hypothetical protein
LTPFNQTTTAEAALPLYGENFRFDGGWSAKLLKMER